VFVVCIITSLGSVTQCVCVCVSSKIGEDQTAEDAEDGPPELLVCDCFMSLLSLFITSLNYTVSHKKHTKIVLVISSTKVN